MSKQPTVAILAYEISSYKNRPNPSSKLKSLIENEKPNINLVITETPEEAMEISDEIEIVITSGVSSSFLDEATQLRWVQSLSIGVDHYDLDLLRSKKLILTNASGVKSEPIAEQVIAQMIMFERLLPAIENERSRRWEKYEGGEIRGKTLGIIGVGSIGERIAEYGSSFDMTVIGTKRDTNSVSNEVDEIYQPEELDQVVPRSDYLIISCPLTEKTRGLIGSSEIAQMKSSAVLVNVGRGPIVDEEALTNAIIQNHIRGAALDVFEEEPLPSDSLLWVLPNVFVSPHMAGSTPKKWNRSAELFIDNYELFINNNPEHMKNKVILPD